MIRVAVMRFRSCASKSRFAVSKQQESDEDKADRPDPAGPTSLCLGYFDFEPARPPGGDAQYGDGQMRPLDEELFLDVSERVRMREQQRAAQRNKQRKNERQPSRRDAPGPYAPFEKREYNDKRHEQPMLDDLGVPQALDEADLAHRPDLGIRAQEQECREEQEQQRTVLSP